MKQIEPINIWKDGKVNQATILNAYAINVSLNNDATFYYSLLTNDMQKLIDGYKNMNANQYDQWEQDEFAWDFIANSLNIKIIGDYTPEVKENEISLEK